MANMATKAPGFSGFMNMFGGGGNPIAGPKDGPPLFPGSTKQPSTAGPNIPDLDTILNGM
jgi:hypothetical protein